MHRSLSERLEKSKSPEVHIISGNFAFISKIIRSDLCSIFFNIKDIKIKSREKCRDCFIQIVKSSSIVFCSLINRCLAKFSKEYSKIQTKFGLGFVFF